MSVLSLACCSLLSAVCAFTLVSSAGCGTSARGVDDCRDIEQARCSAAKNCGIISDVADCQRYYRDQCLHGLPVSSPGSNRVQECVSTIVAAGQCAAQASSADTRLSECPGVTRGAPGVDAACGIVKEPEKAEECSFLTPDVEAGVGGTGGVGGANAAGEAGNGGEGGA